MPGKGLIQIYTGEGKGKSTAAFGQALRAAGQGLRVHIIQFFKGEGKSGEQVAVKDLPLIQVEAFGRPGWVNPEAPEAEDKERARQGLQRARAIMEEGKVDLLILDEVNVALAYGLLSLEEVLELLEGKPESLEVILTGRGAPSRLLERADLVTEMREIRHPRQRGIGPRRGIEF